METDEPATKAAGGEPKPSPATKAAGEQEEDDEEESSGGGGTEPKNRVFLWTNSELVKEHAAVFVASGDSGPSFFRRKDTGFRVFRETVAHPSSVEKAPVSEYSLFRIKFQASYLGSLFASSAIVRCFDLTRAISSCHLRRL
uniref:Uncharacterized protein n=1 Tax=Oryza glumipatula TaxID=40148 RepID=A0A0E0AM35_9ORYZ